MMIRGFLFVVFFCFFYRRKAESESESEIILSTRRGHTKGNPISIFPLHIMATWAFTAKKRTTKNPAKQIKKEREMNGNTLNSMHWTRDATYPPQLWPGGTVYSAEDGPSSVTGMVRAA